MAVRYVLCFLFLFGVGSSLAEDNTVTIISGVSSNVPGGVLLGYTGSNNTLTVSNGGWLTTTNISGIGFWEGASFNSATVTGSGSRWMTRSFFYLGGFGSYNRLNILAGGWVLNSNQTYMAMDAMSTGNTMLVSGAGSVFSATNRSLFLGASGPGNGVTVSNAGRVEVSYLTMGDGATSVSNRLVVIGTGSTVYARHTISCGASGSWNRVEVLRGGSVSDFSGALGSEGRSWHNVAVVDGAGSVWSNRNRFYVGRQGSFNSLLITNGGQVLCDDEGHLGEKVSAVGNRAVVTGPGSRWAVSNVFFVGAEGSSNRLEVRQGGHMDCGWMAFVGDGVLNNSNDHGNSVLITDSGSRWTMSNNLFMGRGSGWNRLDLQNGAFMACSNVYVGWGISEYPSNIVVVQGAGTLWTNRGEFYVSGLGNSLTISNEARLYAAAARVGDGAADQKARLIVHGANSALICPSWFGVAYYGADGEAVITNGGRLASGTGIIGLETYDHDGSMIVTGPGSIWSNAGTLTLGYYGWSNRLWVRQGGRVQNHMARIGVWDLASDNRAWVEGTNSAWLCRGDLFIGYGERNLLSVENGALFACTNAELGLSGVASGNVIRVCGAGAVWTNSGPLQIGTYREARWNGLEIYTGALVYAQSVCIGMAAATENYVRVRGGAAALRCAETFWLGQTGSFNRLWIEDGARVDAASLVVGYAPGATGNDVQVQTNSLLAVVGAAEIRRGSLRLSQGSVSCSQLVVQTNALLAGAGTLLVGAMENYGWLNVGQPVGRLAVSGAFYQKTGATLSLDLGGVEAGVSHDQVAIAGVVGLGGTLAVSRVVGFLPFSNATFCVLAYTSLPSGYFTGTNLPAWFDWQLSSSSSGLLLRVVGVQCATQNVPKAWLVDHGWTNDFDNAALGDPDADRVPTWQEYFAGTDPNDAGSVFQCLDIAQELSPIPRTVLRWQAATGCVYAVDVSTNLLTPAWAVLTNQLSAPVYSWTDTVTQAGSGQYRLRVNRP